MITSALRTLMLVLVLLGAAAIVVAVPMAAAAEVAEDAEPDTEAILPASPIPAPERPVAMTGAEVGSPPLRHADRPPIPPPER